MECRELVLSVAGEMVHARMDDGAESQSSKIELTPLRSKTIGLFQDGLATGTLGRRELEILGWNLYEALFSGDVGTFFQVKYKEVSAQKGRLRVQLCFAEGTDDLAALPWEYLYHPRPGGKPFFFSTEVSLVLSRFVGRNEARLTSIEAPKRPVNILIVVATPAVLKPEDQGKVIAKLESLHQTYSEKELFNFRTADSLRNLADLEQLLAHGDVDVLHFIGYGRYRQHDQTGEISLEDEGNQDVWFSNEDFAASLTRQKDGSPRLVFLHLCKSGALWQGDLKATFAGLALPLVMSGVPAVVAMQYPLAPSAAVMFFEEFYKRLASDDPIDVAIQAARSRTAANNPREIGRLLGTPIFYMQSTRGVLIPSTDSTGEGGGQQGDGPGAVRTGVVPESSSLRTKLLLDIANEPEATEEERAWVRAFLDRAWTDDTPRLEGAIRQRFSETDPEGQLRIYVRMLSTLKSEQGAFT